MRRLARLRSACTFLLAAAACQSDVVLVDPALERSALAVAVTLEDAELARKLGWLNGVPDASVSLRWSRAPAVTEATDSAGLALFPNVPAGVQWIAAQRALAESPYVLGGGAIAVLERGKPVTVEVRGHVPGSLVISEYYYHSVTAYAPNYFYAGYLELTNDADSTIYLDGKIIGSAFNYNFDAPLWRCSETAPMRVVEGGVYAQFLQAFPGSGRDFPLAPGDVVVIADQAIDHSALYAELPDLRGADFEFGFKVRANNPAVPDLIDVGLVPIDRRDRRFAPIFDVAFVANPLMLSSLPRTQPKYQGDFALIPTAAILELASFIAEDQIDNFVGIPLCTEGSVHPSLDRRDAWMPSAPYPAVHRLAMHRKREPRSGRLQRTGTSDVDFEFAPRSPGRLR